MGRKKKSPEEPKETSEGQTAFHLEDILGSDAKRSIAAVFLFVLALLFALAFFETAGVLGKWLDVGAGIALGYGKWLLPPLFIVAGLMFLKRRTTTLADAVKFVGLFVAFFSVLGLLHLYSGEDGNELLRVARAGEGGGFVGLGLAYVLQSLTGVVAGTAILIALFLSGMIAAFNVSLMRFWEHWRERFRNRADDRSDGITVSSSERPDTTPAVVVASEPQQGDIAREISSNSTETLAENNIRNVQFEEGKTVETPAGTSFGSESEATSSDVDTKLPRRRSVRRQSTVRWEFPPTDLLESTTGQGSGGDTERNKHIIQNTLKYFGIDVEPGEARIGPTVTQYTFRPAFGVKLSRITTLANDLAMALAAQSIRIEAPIPGQSLVGIEVPNKTVATVRLKAILESPEFRNRISNLTLVLGQDVAGKHILADLRKMPHLLIAGRTGSGKSVCINTLLLSLLYQNSPDDLKLIMVDPKRVELSVYNGIPHLRTDVIVENKRVVNVLRWTVGEMERRYKTLGEAHARDLSLYRDRAAKGETRYVTDADGRMREEPLENLPYLVIVIDEMADLMVAHGKEVEALIVRLAQMSRAVGIHLILATQRPEVTVITGLIKANIPARAAFQVKSQIDSRTILDGGGAEKLLGNGDMLYAPAEGSEMKRLQGVFVSDDEVKRVTAFLRKQGEEREAEDIEDIGQGEFHFNASGGGDQEDELFERAKDVLLKSKRASTTYLQTALGIGYPRAARLMTLLEDKGIVGTVDGKKVLLANAGTPAEEMSLKTSEHHTDNVLSEQAERDKWQL